MLWDLIRDFFVQHVFGGYDSNAEYYYATIGYYEDDVYGVGDYTCSFFGKTISIGDWFSTTATAISITIIVVLCCLFIYKIVRLIGGLIR